MNLISESYSEVKFLFNINDLKIYKVYFNMDYYLKMKN